MTDGSNFDLVHAFWPFLGIVGLVVVVSVLQAIAAQVRLSVGSHDARAGICEEGDRTVVRYRNSWAAPVAAVAIAGFVALTWGSRSAWLIVAVAVPAWLAAVFVTLRHVRPGAEATTDGLVVRNTLHTTRLLWDEVTDIRFERRDHLPMQRFTQRANLNPWTRNRAVPYRAVGFVYRNDGEPVEIEATRALSSAHAWAPHLAALEPTLAASRVRVLVDAWMRFDPDGANAALARHARSADAHRRAAASDPGPLAAPRPLVAPAPMAPMERRPPPPPPPPATAPPRVVMPGLPPPPAPWQTRMAQPAWHPGWNRTEIPPGPVSRSVALGWRWNGGPPSFTNRGSKSLGPAVGIWVVFALVIFFGPAALHAAVTSHPVPEVTLDEPPTPTAQQVVPTTTVDAEAAGVLACGALRSVRSPLPLVRFSTAKEYDTDVEVGACVADLDQAGDSLSLSHLRAGSPAEAAADGATEVDRVVVGTPPSRPAPTVHRFAGLVTPNRRLVVQAAAVRSVDESGDLLDVIVVRSGSDLLTLRLIWYVRTRPATVPLADEAAVRWAAELFDRLAT